MGFVQRVDRLQRRHRALAVPVAVLYKFIDDHGNYLAALVTYYGFLSLFPLLLLLTSVVGFILESEPDWRDRVVESALQQFPVIGSELSNSSGLQGSTTAVVIGVAIAVWAAVRACQATLHMMNICWAVPRHKRPDPLRSPIHALPLIGAAALVVVGSTIVSGIASWAAAYSEDFRTVTAVGVLLLAVLFNTAVFLLGMKVATAYPVTWRQVLPGAVTAAIGWQLLQLFGTAYVGQIVREAGDAYGVFTVVLGLMGFIFVAAFIVVMSVELNVVLTKGLYPRALLAPFSDRVEYTLADRQVHSDVTRATRIKGYQEVDVRFDRDTGTDAGPPRDG